MKNFQSHTVLCIEVRVAGTWTGVHIYVIERQRSACGLGAELPCTLPNNPASP